MAFTVVHFMDEDLLDACESADRGESLRVTPVIEDITCTPCGRIARREDRRQRARECAGGEHPEHSTAVERAIEAATQVRITPEMVNPVPRGSIYLDEAMRRTIACQVLEAAGFEVVE